jgi:hypothetical protein
MEVNRYFGRTTLYRILRPLCISELIERQIAYADFSVVNSAVDLLKFKRNAFAIFSGDRLVNGHSKVDWSKQAEHVFFDQIGRCANLLIFREGDGPERSMRYHEFEQLILDPERVGDFEPFPRIMADMSLTSKLIFWLRLVAYANLCNSYINTAGTEIGFETRDFPVSELLKFTQDSEICSNLAEYTRRCTAVPYSAL